MKLYTTYLLLFFSWLLAQGAGAQVVLTQEQCRTMALEYSQLITIAEQQKSKSEHELKAYNAKYFPSLSATGFYFYKPGPLSYGLDGGYLPTYVPGADGQLQPNLLLDGAGQPVIGPDGNPVFKQYAFMPDMELELGLEGVGVAGLQLQQPVYMGGKIRTANKMARLATEMSDENLRVNRANVLQETDQAYWQYVAVWQKLAAARQYQSLLAELEKTVADAHEVGMANRNDLLKVKVKANEAALMVQKAQNGLDLSRMNLCRLIGLPFEADITIDEETQMAWQEVALADADSLSLRPEYLLLEKDIALKEKQVDLVRSDFLPQVGVMASYSYFNGVQLNGINSSDASFSALASVNIPIFAWGEGRHKVNAAKAEMMMSQARMQQYEELMTLEIAQARYTVKDAVARLQMTTLSVEQASENLRMSKDLYELGMETLSDHLEAQAQLQQVQSEHIEAMAGVKLSETAYLKAVGKLDR